MMIAERLLAAAETDTSAWSYLAHAVNQEGLLNFESREKAIINKPTSLRSYMRFDTVTRNTRDNRLTSKHEPSTNVVKCVQPTPNGAAKRMRRYRERRREGLRCLTVQLWEREIEALIHRGLLPFETRHDKNAIIKALHDFFDLALRSNR